MILTYPSYKEAMLIRSWIIIRTGCWHGAELKNFSHPASSEPVLIFVIYYKNIIQTENLWFELLFSFNFSVI